MSDTRCTFPYKQINISPIGEYSPCCQFVAIGDELSNIKSIQEYINSDKLADIKQKLDNGVRIPECKYCWRQEDAGFTSMRQRHLISHSEDHEHHYTESNIREFFIEFGNMCNTACRMCHGGRSSLIADYQKKYVKVNPNTPLKDIFVYDDFFVNEKYWYKDIGNSLLEYVEDLDFIFISGGEPFINVYFDRFIDTLVNSGKKLPKIRITTNGSFTAEQIQKLEAFKSINIHLSTDSLTKDYYEYLRWPLTYDHLLESIEILKNFKPENKEGLYYEFHFVLQNLNLLDLAASLNKFNEMFLHSDDRFKIKLNMINSSEWYQSHNSPKWVREKAIEQLKTVKFHERIEPELNKLIEFLSSEHPVYKIDTLEQHVAFTDSYRGVNTWEFLGWDLKDIS